MQSGQQQRLFVGLLQYFIAQFKDLAELATQLVLEVFGLGGSHLLGREVKDFLAEQLQDGHVIFA